eukprot:6206791-Pleurochrysis_carterae.AAC.1
MENEHNVSRGEPQSVAQVDNPRGEPKACTHLMLYHVGPPSMEARTLATGPRTSGSCSTWRSNGRAKGHGRATGLRRQHSHGEGTAPTNGGHSADGGEAWASVRGPRGPRADPPTVDGGLVLRHAAAGGRHATPVVAGGHWE